MLGEAVARAAVEATERPVDSAPVRTPSRAVPALDVQALTIAGLHGVSFSLAAGEVLGIAALEGQGQDELFNALAGASSLASGEIHVAGRPLKARHPYDAIRAGVVLVPADRLHALLPQRSVRENIAAPRYNSIRRWGPISLREEARLVGDAIAALQIDTRAARQVRRLSGGNQQKVTIARWLASGFKTMLCFDPTRGIDVGTKRQIYALLRRLADDGAAILFFSSELAEFPARLRPGADALRRADHRRASWRRRRRGDSAGRDARSRRGRSDVKELDVRRLMRRHGWTVGVYLLLLALVMYWRSTTALPWGPFDVQSVAIDALPLALAACGQAIAIISGGIDLSIGSMMSLVNVVSARWMLHMSFREALLFALLLVLAGALAGALTGLTIIVTRVADIIVTLAMLFVWAGAALAVMTIPSGGAPLRFGSLVTVDTIGTKWFPSALLVLAIPVAILWLPIRRSRAGSRSTPSARTVTPRTSQESTFLSRGSAPTHSAVRSPHSEGSH